MRQDGLFVGHKLSLVSLLVLLLAQANRDVQSQNDTEKVPFEHDQFLQFQTIINRT